MTTAIYTPKGAALEYAPLACNIYRGCEHRCRYCFAPGCLHVTRESFRRAAVLRTGVVEQAEKDVRKMAERKQFDRVHLCFTCDPYPRVELDQRATRAVIWSLYDFGIPVSILTKAGMLAARDFDVLSDMDAEFGVSLVWADDRKRAEWEPNAAPVEERLELLLEAHRRGIKTWVSMEPVVDPAEALAVLDKLIPIADTIKVGRWNHDGAANAIDWRSFAVEVKARLEAAGVRHMLKKGLAELVPAPAREVTP